MFRNACMLGVLLKIWKFDQKDQIYLSLFLDISAGVAGEDRVFVGNRFDPYSVFSEHTQHVTNDQNTWLNVVLLI